MSPGMIAGPDSGLRDASSNMNKSYATSQTAANTYSGYSNSAQSSSVSSNNDSPADITSRPMRAGPRVNPNAGNFSEEERAEIISNNDKLDQRDRENGYGLPSDPESGSSGPANVVP